LREVFTEDLPRWRFGKGQPSGVIDWRNSIGIRVKFIYDGLEGEIEIVDYNAKTHMLSTEYIKGKIIKINTVVFVNGNIRTVLGLRSGDFKIKVETIFKDEKRDLIILNREYRTKSGKSKYNKNEKWYKYKCNKCDYEDWMVESSLITQKCGCPVCCPFPQKTVLGFNTIWDTTPWMIPIVGEEIAKTYSKASDKKIYPICPDCGRVKNKLMSLNAIYKVHSMNCSCGDGKSYPEKFTFSILEQLDIEFSTEYIPDWIKPRKYDFYFKKDNIDYIIEVDGGFHTKDNKMNGQTKEEIRMIDDYKDDMADRYGFEMIRIDCEKSEQKYIKNNIQDSILNNLFDLSQINWNKAEEFALSNLVKVVCD